MDDTGNGRWLTYSELATIRGINRASAVKLVQRERWQRSSGNERSRVVRVLVPDDWLTPAKEIPPDTASVPGMSGEYTGMLMRAERAEQRADEANKRADVAVALADRTLTQLAEAMTEAGKLREQFERGMAHLDAERSRADELRGRLDDMGNKLTDAQAELATAQDQVEALEQAEAERRARGVLARLRAAWRGE